MILFFTVALIHFIALVVPGPDLFFVSQTAVSRSRTQAMQAVLGITLGTMVWAAIALMGLHVLLIKMAWWYHSITIGGGLYLTWMGYGLLCRALNPVNAVYCPVEVVLAQGKSLVWRGFFTHLSNPKVMIYFWSIFSLWVGDDINTGMRVGLFILIVCESFVWFSLVASLFALPVIRRGYLRIADWIDSMAGILFMSFGGYLISQF